MVLGLDILNEIADRLGYPQISSLDSKTITSETRKLKRALNRVLQTLQGVREWPQLRSSGEIVLVPDEETDADSDEYVTATQNSTTLTVDNYSFDKTYLDRAIQVSGDNYVYRIKKVLSSTQVTLNRAWISDSITASDEKTATIAADRYALPTNFDRPVGSWENFFSPYKILPIDNDELREKRYGQGIEVDDPQYFTIWGMNDAQTAYIVLLHPYPDERRMLTFEYQRNHPEVNSDNDKILYPNSYLSAIIDMVLYIAHRDFDDDEKMQITLMDKIREYNMQASNPTLTDKKMILRPRNRTRTDIRKGFGNVVRINWGTYWDRQNAGDLD